MSESIETPSLKITLYKKGKLNTQIWEVEVQGSKYRTLSGQLDGKKVLSEWTQALGKNLNKLNETAPENQAILEATSRAKKKRDKGYSDSLETMVVYKEPTLAKVYEDYSKVMTFPAALSPKLDGVRCLISKNGMTSRNHKPILSCPHILERLTDFFAAFPDLVLDGELYNHKLSDDFDKIISLSRQMKPTQQDFDDSKALIEFHVFDVQTDEKFWDRFRFLKTYLSDLESIVVVPQIKVNGHEEISNFTKDFLKMTFEGSMVRWGLDEGYIFNRTKKMLKVKTFITEEFPVVEILDGKGKRSGTVGKWVVRLPSGKTNEVGPSGSDEKNLEIYKNKESFVGKPLTVKYQGYTKKGQLRFPTAVTIRDYE